MLYNLSVEQGVRGGRSALCESEAIFFGWEVKGGEGGGGLVLEYEVGITKLLLLAKVFECWVAQIINDRMIVFSIFPALGSISINWWIHRFIFPKTELLLPNND